MSNIGTLLKLEIKDTALGSFKISDYKSWIKAIFQLGFIAALFYMVYFGAQIFFSMFRTAGIAYEALILFFTAIFIILLASAISGTIRVLYFKGDNEILIRYPVHGYEIFISKIFFLLIRQIILTALIVTPFLLAYAKIEPISRSFLARIPVVVIFLVSIPFLGANVLAIPIMHLTNRIRNKFTLIIIMLALLITALFALYMWLFNNMVNYMKEQSFSVFDHEVVNAIKSVCMYLFPKNFADLLVSEKLYIAYPSLIITNGVCLALTVLIIGLLYFKTLLSNIEIEGSAFKRKTRNRVRPVFISLLRKEFIQVFRSVNYSFQYFVLACAMPGMVFFSNNIVQNLAREQAGDRMVFGVMLLVMMVFTTIITSFAATTVSREGANFFLTKTAPIKIRTQLLAKFVMYMIVSILANLLSIAIMVAIRQMSWQYGILTFAIVQLNAVTLTLIAMRTDIDRPVFNLVGDAGEIQSNNVNTTRAVALGMLLSLLLGMLGMIFGSNLKLIIIVIVTLTLIFLIYGILRYEIRLRKRYYSINN